MRGMLLIYSFELRPKSRVLVTLGSVMTIDAKRMLALGKKRKQFREREQD